MTRYTDLPVLVYYLAVEHHVLTHRGYLSTFFTGFLASPSNKWGKAASVFISGASSGYIFAFLALIREKKFLVLELSLCNTSNLRLGKLESTAMQPKLYLLWLDPISRTAIMTMTTNTRWHDFILVLMFWLIHKSFPPGISEWKNLLPNWFNLCQWAKVEDWVN